MLSDRPYMRDDYEREKTSILTWLISAIIAGFIIQVMMGSGWIGIGGRLNEFMGLSVRSLEQGWLWTLVTHALLHSTDFVVHVIFNVLALYFLGRELMPMLGPRRFMGVFVAATVLGGLEWAAVHWRNGGGEFHLGATAAVYALFIIFACFFPNQQITFLLFFVLPVTVKPKHLAFVLVGFSLVGLLAYEVPGNPFPLGIDLASSAHLGGILAGFLYYRFIHDSRWSLGSPDRPEMELPRWLKRARRPVPVAPTLEVEVGSDVPATKQKADIRAEVDRILDKINSEGFRALTPQEKRVLDDAKDLLSRQ